MFRKEASEIVASLTGRPMPTIVDTLFPALQDGKMLPRGVRGRGGGVELNSMHRVSLLLAAALDHDRGESVAKEVKRWRSSEMRNAVSLLPHPKMSREDNIREAFDFVHGLGIKFDNLGTALDGLVESMRTGTFEKWREEVVVFVTADFYGDHNLTLLFDRPQFKVSAAFEFGPKQPEPPIERIVRMNGPAFERLAQP